MSDVLSISEILARFQKEYVLLDQCRFDDRGCSITHARVVSSSDNRDEVYRRLHDTPNTVIVYAGPQGIEQDGAFLDGGSQWDHHSAVIT